MTERPAYAAHAVAMEKLGPLHEAAKDAAGATVGVYCPATDAWFAPSAAPAPARFAPTAWIVVGLYFAVLAAMTWHFARKKKSADDYFKGGGRIPWYVAGVSIFATMLSSVTFIASPVIGFTQGYRYLPLVFCTVALLPFVTRFFLPFFRALNFTSAYEYLERRFNLGTRLFGSAAFIVYMVLRIAVVTLLPALVLNAATGVSVDACILVCGAVTIVYCSLGGLEAVVWSDFVQGFVLMAGAMAVLAALVLKTDGGLAGAWRLADAGGRLRVWDFRWLLSEPVFWVILVQGFVGNMCSYASDQCVIQRYMSVKDMAAARRSMWVNGALCLWSGLTFYGIGAGLWTHYKCHPEMLPVDLPKADGLLPAFMAAELPSWLAGLVVAALFAATVSTLSANLSGAASAWTADFVKRFRPRTDSDGLVRAGRAATVAAGALGTAAALGLARMETHALFDVFQELLAVLTAGLMALFFIGVFLPRVKGRAAFAGLMANYAACLAFKYAPWPDPRPHFFLGGGVGFATCIAVALALSYVLPEKGGSLEGLTWKTRRGKLSA